VGLDVYGSSGRASAKPFQDLLPTAEGAALHRLMRLSTISVEDQRRFLRALAAPDYLLPVEPDRGWRTTACLFFKELGGFGETHRANGGGDLQGHR
jgi:hypothetical protein